MIIKFSQLTSLQKKLRKKKIVFAGGTFDIFHEGHIAALRNLRNYGDIVVIAVNSDQRVKERKGRKRPILSAGERVRLVDAIRFVDYSLVAPGFSLHLGFPTIRIIEKLRPNVFVTVDHRWLKFRPEVEQYGTKLKVLPRIKENSTTRIVSRIARRYSIK